MQENILEIMKNFEPLWQRIGAVGSWSPPPPPLRPEAELLLFRNEELCLSVAEENFARLSRGPGTKLMQKMAAEDRNSAAQLAAVYEKTTGRPKPRPGNCCPEDDIQGLIRRKSELLQKYKKAADQTTKQFRPLYSRLAWQKNQQLLMLRRLQPHK